MTQYSTERETEEFVAKLGPRPLFVCDMDGNIMRGYSLAPGKSLALGEGDNPDNQAIPFGTSQTELQRLVDDGTLVLGLFADKAMDARLPAELVDLINRNTRTGNKYSLGFLTSRGAKDAVKLMKESGVEQPEQATLVADSGGALYFDGVRTDVRKLSDEENDYILAIDGMADKLNRIVQGAVRDCGFDPEKAPAVFIEQKGTACNVHFRTILRAFDQPEGSDLDKAIGSALKAEFDAYAKAGPDEDDGSKVFKVLGAPAAVEMKIAKVNKGHGLEATAEKAMQLASPPTAIVFSGDDIAKADGGPGTDYFGMIRADELQARFGIPFFNVHTHHPEGGKLDGTTPDPNKAPERLTSDHPVPRVDLVVPRPGKLVELILKTLRERGLDAAA
ncbi:MAG: hypothetical protein EOM26_09920 [Alphaproteobacteria bacterium]|nr:hypothetical protein [Alphaproteobacteria bacterium]